MNIINRIIYWSWLDLEPHKLWEVGGAVHCYGVWRAEGSCA